ncbi:SGNH/GDSL hydrolase family protein [Granulicoccus sp. GXG6511]|uniref:SGNH/GDSL hydrolase family protein n=1 Tax=Granulicoccus sp. GXG6511 TaxID=3381351 RepID=UPI003D7DC4AE
MRVWNRWWRWISWSALVVALTVLVQVGGKRLLTRQAAAAREVIFAHDIGEETPNGEKIYRRKASGRLELLVVGDSIAAGLGAERRRDTIGGRLAKEVARRTDTSVHLFTAAVVGAQTSEVLDQIDGLPGEYRPDLAIVIVGGNDVTHRVPISRSVSALVEVITRLQDRGADVVVATCPNLGAIRPLRQPLRTIAARRSALLATAQRKAALAHGARTVSLGRVVGRIFLAEPETMLGLDMFHPSPGGYRRIAQAMLPSVLAAVGETQDLPRGHYVPRSVRRAEREDSAGVRELAGRSG